MDWDKLATEAKKQKIDSRLYSFKGVEGTGERDRIEIIRQLNVLNPKWWEKTWIQILMLLGAIAGVIGFFFLFANVLDTHICHS